MNADRIAVFLLVSCLSVFGACDKAREAEPASGTAFEVLDEPLPPEALEQARQAARALGTTLLDRLSDEMERGGPERALIVCSEAAYDIAREQSSESVLVRRVSERARNPMNRPDAYELARLRELERLHREGNIPGASAEVVLSDGARSLRFMRPLTVGDACLACHGAREDMDPRVVAALDERYPEDEATGFSAGDFRGAISVAVRLPD